ncbi:NAD(P)/FAD-dependent oxidoreductase [Marinibacterium profundimaris]|uniref:Oxidoreductase n=1 Tax=Marinibacterium profundimaris TaxID=1679460 RepID=A0A225NHY9_9RHOB|nr:FAD-binding oxidoreductase [Marinibacterium profundimaris]OWU72574.1 oxidoreductase [Marinibacterium profundimaris]
MDLLYANDRPGRYPDSWYVASAELPPERPALDGDARVDVCIVGGGYTGLSAALHLAEAGRSVLLLEAHRAGFGASGRNGGQLGGGQRVTQDVLEKRHGPETARQLWELGDEALTLVKDLIARHDIDCDLRPGVAEMASSAAEVTHLHHYAEFLADRYGHTQTEVLDAEAGHALCPSPVYKGGLIDWSSAHLHPLKLALGLARAAEAAGARICEGTRVTGIEDGAQVRVKTDTGTVTADHVILACNGYLGGLEPRVAARVMPINNFIAATEPLGERTADVLTRDVAVADDLFVINYFRLSVDGRLLFGGGESYGYRFPADIAATVRKPMERIFPHLKGVRIDYAWGGTLAITMQRLPWMARLSPRILTASGYSGHGVGTATHAGKLMAQAVQGQSEGFDTFSALPTPVFPGGTALRSPLLALAMSWYALRDRLGL